MEFFRKYRFVLVGFFTVAFVGVGFYLDRSLNEQASALTREIETKQNKLKEYYTNIEKAPSPYLIARLTRDKLTLEGNYEVLASRYAIVPVLTLPEGEIFPALFYKETMYLVLDDLRSEAARRKVGLPSSLGISETGLPSPEQVPALLIILDTLKRLCEEIFRSKIPSLDSVQFGTPVANPFYIEIPLAITVSGTSSRLAYFFENLGSSQTIFVLENMAMARGGGAATTTTTPVAGTQPLATPGMPGPGMAAPLATTPAAPVGETFQASLSLKRIIWGKELVEKIKIAAPVAAPAAPSRPGMVPGAPGMPPGTPGMPSGMPAPPPQAPPRAG